MTTAIRGPRLAVPPAGTAPARLAPLRASTLAVQVAEVIRELIASGELQAGDRLVEARIAEQLEVSRGPVREAMRLLGAEGLLRDEPRRGTFVAELTPDDVRDIYDLRAALEARAARLVIERRRPEDLDVVEVALDGLREAARSPGRKAPGGPAEGRRERQVSAAARAVAIAAADYRFHEAICRASGNGRLLEAFTRNATELRVLLQIDEELLYHPPGSIVPEHAELLGAIRSAEPAAADRALRAHLEEARDRVVAYAVAAPRGPVRGRPARATRGS